MWRWYLCSVYCAVEPVPSSQVIIRLVFCFFPLYLMCWMDFWYSSTSPRHPTYEIISIQTPAQFQQGRKSQEGEIQSVFEVFVIPNRGMGTGELWSGGAVGSQSLSFSSSANSYLVIILLFLVTSIPAFLLQCQWYCSLNFFSEVHFIGFELMYPPPNLDEEF